MRVPNLAVRARVMGTRPDPRCPDVGTVSHHANVDEDVVEVLAQVESIENLVDRNQVVGQANNLHPRLGWHVHRPICELAR